MGHGGAGNVKKEIRKQGLEGRTIYQGCGVDAEGDIQYQAYQTGTNGDWQHLYSTDFLERWFQSNHVKRRS